MDKGQTTVFVRKLNATLSVAQSILKETYAYELPVAAVQILCIVYRNHMVGNATYVSNLEKELNMTIPSISRHVSKLSVWANLKTKGAGYLEKNKDYNDEGYQVNALRMTEKGVAVVQRIAEVME